MWQRPDCAGPEYLPHHLPWRQPALPTGSAGHLVKRKLCIIVSQVTTLPPTAAPAGRSAPIARQGPKLMSTAPTGLQYTPAATFSGKLAPTAMTAVTAEAPAHNQRAIWLSRRLCTGWLLLWCCRRHAVGAGRQPQAANQHTDSAHNQRVAATPA